MMDEVSCFVSGGGHSFTEYIGLCRKGIQIVCNRLSNSTRRGLLMGIAFLEITT